MKKIITLLAIGTVSFCYAQHNIYELIDHGLKNSTTMKAEIISNKNIETDLINSYLGLLPSNSLNFTLSKDNSYMSSSDAEINNATDYPTVDPMETNSVQASFNISKNIRLNEPSIFEIKRAKISSNNAKISVTEIQKNIAMFIFNKYILVLQSKANLKVAMDNLEIQQSTLDMSKIKHITGNLSDYDLQMSEINLITQQIQVTELENNLKELRKSLFSYINMEDDFQELQELDIAYSKPVLSKYKNNEILLAENNIKKQKISIFQQKLGLFPMPSVGISYSSQNMLNSNNLVDSLGINISPDYNTLDVFDSNDFSKNLSLNFGISYNIFDIPRLLNNYSVSKRNFYITKLNFDELSRTNKDNIEMALLQMESLESTLELYEKKLILSLSNFEMSQKQYELGLINITDLEKSRVELFNAEIIKNNKQYLLLQKQETLNLLISNKILGKY